MQTSQKFARHFSEVVPALLRSLLLTSEKFAWWSFPCLEVDRKGSHPEPGFASELLVRRYSLQYGRRGFSAACPSRSEPIFLHTAPSHDHTAPPIVCFAQGCWMAPKTSQKHGECKPPLNTRTVFLQSTDGAAPFQPTQYLSAIATDSR